MINFYLSSCIFLASHWLIVLFHSPWISFYFQRHYFLEEWVLNFKSWSMTFFLQPFDSSSDTHIWLTTVRQIAKSSNAEMVCFWDRNQCKQCKGVAEHPNITVCCNKCQCFLPTFKITAHSRFIAQLLFISLKILTNVFNVCLFVYFLFNFEQVLVGATACSKSGIVMRFTGMVKTVR